MRKRVAVFFGGNSNEHEISVITGVLAVNLLRSGMYEVLPVYLLRGGGMATGGMTTVKAFSAPSKKWKSVRFAEGGVCVGRKFLPIDVALNCCHGGMGENGILSALLEAHHIPSASPGVAVSSVFMEKSLGKLAAKGLGLNVVPSFVVREGEGCEERARALGYPLILKPMTLGSSIGIEVVREEGALEGALKRAFELDGAVLVEKYLEGKRDLNCAAYRRNGRTALSPVEEVFSGEDILTFSEKYEGKGARRSKIPAEIDPALCEEVQRGTKSLYEAFGVRGVVRADFLLHEGKVYFNELNTVPGSLASYLFGDTLLDAKRMLLSLIEEGLVPRREHKIVVTGILQSELFEGAKACKRR